MTAFHYLLTYPLCLVNCCETDVVQFYVDKQTEATNRLEKLESARIT